MTALLESDFGMAGVEVMANARAVRFALLALASQTDDGVVGRRVRELLGIAATDRESDPGRANDALAAVRLVRLYQEKAPEFVRRG
jgi:hypothetical protein